MALHLIISGFLTLLESTFLSHFLGVSAQLLNFAVLLSYPINFFIYCRMSRAFREAFTQLLCPSIGRLEQERLQPVQAKLILKPYHNNNNNDDHNFELKNMKNADIEILPSSTVILNAKTAETPKSSTTIHHRNNDEKKSSIVSLGKQRVLFRDDVNKSTNTRFTDL